VYAHVVAGNKQGRGLVERLGGVRVEPTAEGCLPPSEMEKCGLEGTDDFVLTPTPASSP
jgi:hypothetical protein